MSTKKQLTTGLDASWRPSTSHVTLGAGLSGDVFVGERVNTMGGTAVGTKMLLVSNPVSEGTGVSEPGVAARRRDESGLALARGEFAGGAHALKETPRRYGALGECPRRIPA